MNHALKASLVASCAASLPLSGAVSFFHSSPVLERKRRTHCNYGRGLYSSKRFNIYAKRTRRMESKRTLLRDISEYAEYLFQSWRDNDSTPWFRRPYWSKGAKLNGFSSHESQEGRCKSKRKDGFDFCTIDEDDEDDVDTIFQFDLGGDTHIIPIPTQLQGTSSESYTATTECARCMVDRQGYLRRANNRSPLPSTSFLNPLQQAFEDWRCIPRASFEEGLHRTILPLSA